MQKTFQFNDEKLIEKLADLIKDEPAKKEIQIRLTKTEVVEDDEVQSVHSMMYDANLKAERNCAMDSLAYCLENNNKDIIFNFIVGEKIPDFPVEIEINPKGFRYFSNQIPDQKIFDLVIDGCKRLKDTVDFPLSARLKKDELDMALEIVRRDYPELWTLNLAQGINYSCAQNCIAGLKIYDPNVVSRQQLIEWNKCIQKEVTGVTSQITGATPYDKELNLYNYFINNITINRNSPQPFTIYDCLVRKECSGIGITHALKLIADKLQLQILTVVEAGLAWNMIKLDDQFYHLDACHDNHTKDYKWFNFDDANFFIMTRKIITNLSIPSCVSLKYNFHEYNHQLVKKCNIEPQQQMETLIINKLKQGVYDIMLYFDDQLQFNVADFVKTSQLGWFTSLLQKIAEQLKLKNPSIGSINYWDHGLKFKIVVQ